MGSSGTTRLIIDVVETHDSTNLGAGQTMREPPIRARCWLLTISTLAFALAGCVSTPPKIEPGRLASEQDWASRIVEVQILLNGKILSKGTGAWIGPGRVVTAAHVVDEVPAEGSIVVANFRGSAAARVLVVGHRDGTDAALLEVTNRSSLGSGAELPILNICSKQLQPSDQVWIGLVRGGIFAHGSPDRVRMYKGSVYTNELTIHLQPGDSGSAVYDVTRGCLVGVVSQSGKAGQVDRGKLDGFFTTKITEGVDIRPFVDQLE